VLCTFELVIGRGSFCCQCGTTGLQWVPWFQGWFVVPMGSGSGGGHGTAGCWGWSQFLSKFRCAMVDCAVALPCQSLAALAEASHCHLSLCERSKVLSTVSWKSVLDALGIPLVPMLYCSLIFVLTSRSFIWFSCWQWSSSLQWSHCCLACLSIHFNTSEAHFLLDCQSWQFS